MAPLTTGYSSTAQATELLTKLRTDLPAYTVGRGPLWALPERPMVLLLGPASETSSLGLGVDEARWRWTVVCTRDVVDGDRRAEELDTIADTVMASLMDLAHTATTFDYQGGDGPVRLGDEQMVDLLEKNPRLDALGIVFYTRTEVIAPC